MMDGAGQSCLADLLQQIPFPSHLGFDHHVVSDSLPWLLAKAPSNYSGGSAGFVFTNRDLKPDFIFATWAEFRFR